MFWGGKFNEGEIEAFALANAATKSSENLTYEYSVPKYSSLLPNYPVKLYEDKNSTNLSLVNWLVILVISSGLYVSIKYGYFKTSTIG